MTLLEMIKKYEKIKKKMHMAQQKEDEEIVEAILEDLKAVAEEYLANETPQKISYRVKINVLKEMERAMEQKCYNDVHTLARALSLIS